MQEHEGEEAGDLARVGEEPAQQAREAHPLAAEVAAHERVAGGGRVALVEDQIDHPQHAVQPLGQGVLARHRVGDARGADLRLGAHEPLGHRRRRHEEGARDLVDGKAAEGLEGERHLGFEGERGVTAGEDQPHEVVREGLLREAGCRDRRLAEVGDLGLLRGQVLLAAQAVDRLVPRRGDQPRARVPRHAAGRPLLERGGERFLQRLLGDVEVTEEADQGREGPGPLLAI